MANSSILCGIDIGTAFTKILAVSKTKKQPARHRPGAEGDWQAGQKEDLEVIFRDQIESQGMRKGVVVSPVEASSVLQELIGRMAKESGQKCDLAYVNVGGSHVFASPSRGLISVSRADQKISEEDVQRVLQAAESISLPRNKEIFDVIPREFIVDGEKGIKEAVGLKGVRLEAEVLVLGGFAPYLGNLNQTILSSDIQQIANRVPSPIAASRACLTKKQMESGVALVDIGAGTTGLAVFEEGDLIHLVILPVGSANITNDIAIGLKIDLETAEKLKIEYGSCLPVRKQKQEKIETEEGDYLTFSQKQLSAIIVPRIAEIFREINKELKKISKEKMLPSGIVLTGGGSKLPGISDLAKKETRLSVRLGVPRGILNLRDPSFSACCGLVLGGVSSEEEGRHGNVSDLGFKIKRMLKVFIP